MSSEQSVVSAMLSERVTPVELDPMQGGEHLLLSDTAGSSTEGSSFGSHCSEHALLAQGELMEGPRKKIV